MPEVGKLKASFQRSGLTIVREYRIEADASIGRWVFEADASNDKKGPVVTGPFPMITYRVK
jgi:hypothetical protein